VEDEVEAEMVGEWLIFALSEIDTVFDDKEEEEEEAWRTSGLKCESRFDRMCCINASSDLN
jgi:hypothetical protein